jgi:hypothetical protein
MLDSEGSEVRVPSASREPPVIRFKGDVPAAWLIPHVLLMFLAILIGVRAGLGAVFRPRGLRGLAWITVAGITLGGLVLGPIVQRYAFGEYWTGFPFGYDLTDNKTLIMWLAWAGACLALRRREAPVSWPRRGAVLGAAAVMLAVYLIPHSLRGSELDYEQLDRGVPAHEAIKTG